MKNLLEIYALAVCFLSVVVFVIISGIGSWGVIEWLAPDFAMSSHNYACYQSDEAYSDCLKDRTYYNENQEEIPKGEELTRRRLSKYQNDLVATKLSGQQTVFRMSIFLVIGLVIFFVHWSLASKVRNKTKAEL